MDSGVINKSNFGIDAYLTGNVISKKQQIGEWKKNIGSAGKMVGNEQGAIGLAQSNLNQERGESSAGLLSLDFSIFGNILVRGIIG